MSENPTANENLGSPVSEFFSSFIFSLIDKLLSESPELYIVAIVPTKTSRAAKEVMSAIPIFQSNPIGFIIGSIVLPNIPA